MFDASVYTQRRNALRSRMNKGIVLLPGNTEAPMNYPANTIWYMSFCFLLNFPPTGMVRVMSLQ